MVARGFDTEQWEALKSARSLLDYMRRSSRSDALFTLTADVGMVYGNPRSALDSNRSLVLYALDIANGDTDRKHRVIVEKVGSRGQLSPAVQRALDHKLIAEAREAWRAFLETVMHDRRRAADAVLRDAESMKRVWPIPELHRTARSVEVRYHHVLADLAAFDAHVQLLLVSDEFSADLCKCRLSECGRFFLTRRTVGRPQTRYCRQEHMLQAHALGSTRRSRKSRAQKARRAK